MTTTRRHILVGAAAAAVTAPVSLIPVATAAGADAGLIELGRRFAALVPLQQQASERRDIAEVLFHARKPPAPDALIRTAADRALGIGEHATFSEPHYDGRFVEHLRKHPRKRTTYQHFTGGTKGRELVRIGSPTFERLHPYPNGDHSIELLVSGVPWPEAQARADEIVAAHDQWAIDTNTVAADVGYTAAHSVEKEIDECIEDLELAIHGTRATSPAGWAVKIAVLRWCHCGDIEFPDDGVTTDNLMAQSIALDIAAMIEATA